MSTLVQGIHHVTAIAGDAQENLDFYAGILGMRLVKRSVNQDDPGTYHLFYADAEGHPGSDLTFFPWSREAPRRRGPGLTAETALAVPLESLEFWAERLQRCGVRVGRPEVRYGARALPATDPDGLELALVETADERQFTAWEESPVAVAKQIRGIHGVRLWERSLGPTAEFLTGVLGFAAHGREGDWHRFGVAGGGSGRWLEVRELPGERRGAWGTGTVHHVAWRVEDDADELELQRRVREAGRRPSGGVDRFWFRSVYFVEPGGVVFEAATDGPDFAVDEDLASLGERLILPPWLEGQRDEIESVLPPLELPATVPRR